MLQLPEVNKHKADLSASEYFGGGQSDDDPIILANCKSDDLANLLWLFYNK
jgi:hypothetical protein